MNLFQEIKEQVTARQVAEHYGLQVRKNGMAGCPFHNDKHPSMKIDQKYYCFGCGERGDAINYVAALFGLSQFGAAKKINEDFGLKITTSEVKGSIRRKPLPTKQERIFFVQKKIRQWKKESAEILTRYLQWLKFWKQIYKPESAEEQWHPLFIEALKNESKIEYLLELLLSGTTDDIVRFLNLVERW